jgi:NTP pyrophosphatase (non-canonical NTP hydrolase)
MNESKNTNFKNEANQVIFPDSFTEELLMSIADIRTKWPNGDLCNFGVTLNRYQHEASKNKAFPEKYAIIYPTIGLLNEAGEMAGKIKKWMRGDVDKLNVADVVSEMGDVLWYLASLATDLNVTLEEVALNNIEKITKRREQGNIKGDGDHREKSISINTNVDGITAKL